MERILVVDDDLVSVTMVRKMLESAEYAVAAYTDPRAAFSDFRPGAFDLVLTDFYMPGMSGEELVAAVHKADPRVPIIVLTSGTDVEATAELFKRGAREYILKPVVPADLRHRVGGVLEEARLRERVARIEEEKRLVELESQKLVNWRMLYAYKDISQTEQMINLLSRTINADGGFAWLDMLSELPREADGGARLDADLYELILASAGSQRSILEYLDFISKIPSMKLELKEIASGAALEAIVAYAKAELAALCAKHGRTLSLVTPTAPLEGAVHVELSWFLRICRELVVNAIKYSPPGSRVVLELARGSADVIARAGGSGPGDSPSFLVLVRNEARELQARDRNGRTVSGIPYDYSELVFDLFFMIESFPTPLAEEEWPDGTGLFVARKMLARMGATIGNGAMVDYLGDKPKPMVQFAIALPLR